MRTVRWAADCGKKAPGPLNLGSKANEEVVDALLKHQGMRRIVGFVKRKTSM
jgi:hypothetical protein